MLRSHRFIAAGLAAAMWLTTTACATTYGYGGQRSGGYGGYGRDVERFAYDNGYRDGVRAGERDGRGGRSFSYNRHDDWRDANDGYRREYGNYDRYRRTYRSGFESGYSESYNRYGNYGRYPRSYPGSPSYPSYPAPSYPNGPGGYGVPRGGYSPAGQNGYRDGLEAGRDDARNRRASDPVRSRRYREGDHDYDNRYGSRDEYKREYRSAFQQGYQDGYRNAGRRY